MKSLAMQISHRTDAIPFECISMLNDRNVECDQLDKHKSVFPALFNLYMIFMIKLSPLFSLPTCQMSQHFLRNQIANWINRKEVLDAFTLTIVSMETSFHTYTWWLYREWDVSSTWADSTLCPPWEQKCLLSFMLLSLFPYFTDFIFSSRTNEERDLFLLIFLFFSSGGNLSCLLLWTTASKNTWLHTQWCKRVSSRRSQIRRTFSDVCEQQLTTPINPDPILLRDPRDPDVTRIGVNMIHPRPQMVWEDHCNLFCWQVI